MPTTFRISHQIDPEKQRLIITVRGRYESTAFIDALIEFYGTIGHPWLYDRIMDMRSADGYVEVTDLLRAGKYLADMAGSPPPPRKRLALISTDPFDKPRLGSMEDMFPKAFIQTFESLDEALDWLDMVPAA
ncbi:hypothetical protein PQU92_00380 [Asticcacaulis sp. BYS171W]|uniref:STAS/SEC14 domain-containing protein n=1 Tax=Asticcacaulis aquaticus TaxID=2984212 RepID=A0ABT5HNT2_9CAUL|nr:hypothetical protein [Asticcacaulis aquaticus]MDC7681720.1 hypothetical protein [Asticcacaulis aquaticus]